MIPLTLHPYPFNSVQGTWFMGNECLFNVKQFHTT